MQRWEIAGISMLPVVEFVMLLNTQLGSEGQPLVSEALLLQAFAAVATLAAIVRAVMDKRKAGA